MLNVLRGWIHRYFSDEEAVVLAVLLVTAFAVVLTLGDMLAPVLAGLVLAFLCSVLRDLNWPRPSWIPFTWACQRH